MPRTAAALIIGNEILTGKIQESNLSYLGQELFALGISMQRAIVCEDVIDIIVRDLNELRTTHDYVFTSGGVGPTHDDVTLPAVAKAFDRALVRSPEIESLIRGYHKDRELTEGHLRMADVPEGAKLIANQQVRWPTVVIENVYIFPGVPEIFRMKFPVLKEHLKTGLPFISRAVYTHCDEGEIADLLAGLAERYPDLAIGSYLRWRGTDYRVKLTFDGQDRVRLGQALDEFVAALPPDKIVRIDD